MNPKLIIALDYEHRDDALALVDKLDPSHCALKVGSEMHTQWGSSFVTQLIKRQFNVFLDLKFHDIPNTVARACRVAADLGVWMTNVHAQGGPAMLEAAVKALDGYGSDKPLLIAVTVLTSFDEATLKAIGVLHSLKQQVLHLATLAKNAGLAGVVSSAQEAQFIKKELGSSFLTVTPGIRLQSDDKNDQQRIMTPEQALREGSDYLVIGRSITQAANPTQIVANLIKSMG